MENFIKRRKTSGAVSANLVMTLVDKGKRIFEIRDVVEIVGNSNIRAADLLYRMVERGLVMRVKKGKYMLIPQEAGSTSMYIENYYVIAHALASPRQYYVSHYSAMDIHNMLIHPVTKIYISSTSRIQNVNINNIQFKFIFCNQQRFWGFRELWVTKQDKCYVSDIEKTILDCLYQPQYCGGVSEITNGIWVKRKDIDYDKLIKYCQKMTIKAPLKRLGYIMEMLEIGEHILSPLRNIIKDNSYVPLEPLLSKTGKYSSEWGLILNIEYNELKKVIET